MVTTLNYAEAVEYIWTHSRAIRDWYTNEHKFNLNNYSRSEYRTSGLGAPGDIISAIIADGITDGIINENVDGVYRTV